MNTHTATMMNEEIKATIAFNNSKTAHAAKSTGSRLAVAIMKVNALFPVAQRIRNPFTGEIVTCYRPVFNASPLKAL